MTIRVCQLAAGLLAVLPCVALSAVPAPKYPTKPVRLIVPFTPAGSADTIGRVLADQLARDWPYRVVVDNRSGGAGIIGTELGARAEPDGHTLLLSYVSLLSVNPWLYPQLPYDPVKDLAPITQLTTQAYVLVAHPSVPVKTVKELIALANSKPDQLHYASPGTGTAPHLAGVLFDSMAKTRMTHIPYKGGAPAMVELIGGHTQLYFASGPNALPHVKANRLRMIAVTSAQRSALMPDTPTIAESGVPGYELTAWYGLAVTSKTPKPLVAFLNAEARRAMNTPEAKSKLDAQGVEVLTNTQEQFAQLIRTDLKKYERLVKDANLKAD